MSCYPCLWYYVYGTMFMVLVHFDKEINATVYFHCPWEYSERSHCLFEWQFASHMTLHIETCIRRTPCIKRTLQRSPRVSA